MKKLSHPHSGFSLIEVTVALGIAAFCLLAILGLLPVGLNSNQAAIEQTVSAGLAGRVAADLRATPKTSPASVQNSPLYQIPIPAAGASTQTLFLREDGTLVGKVGQDADPSENPRYRLTITFAAPAASQHGATTAHMFITWPALADMKASVAPSKFSGAFEAMTAFDRN